jgi:hypothetical protein
MHVSDYPSKEVLINSILFVVPIVMKVFVSNLLFQAGRSALWARVKVPKYLASCKDLPSIWFINL